MLARGQNHCCCKPPKQCEQEVQFNPYNFDETEKPGTTEGFSTSYDSGTSSVTLIGEGSLTTRVTSNPKKIFVHAHILDLNAGSGGITIRRIDSNNSVSLWYLGGTSYELRQGTTVLESITSTSGGEIKLELATPREATTDVLVYIDGVLEHTETGVAFDMPDVLHLGLVVEDPGGANVRFGYLAVSPCPACTPLTLECHGGKPMPVAWRMVVAGVDGEEDTIPIRGFPGCEDPEAPVNIEYCDLFNGDYFLVPRSHTLTNSSGGYCNDPVSNAWGEPPEGWPDCDYISAFPMPNVPGYSTPVPEGFVSGLTKYYCTIPGSTINDLCYYPADRSMGTIPGPSVSVDAIPAVTLGVFHSIPNSTMTFKATLHYGYWEDFDPGEGLQAIYESDPIADTTDFLTTGITLNKVSSSGCTNMPNTLFLDPDSEEAWGLVQQLSKCGQTCTPPVTPQPGQAYCMSVTLVDEADTPITYSVPMGVGYNETTGSWEWTGSIDPWDHPTCGTMASSSYKIHCIEPEEGASKQWVLDITTSNGTSRIPMSDDPEFGSVFDGTLDVFCTGETWDVFAIFPNVLEDTTDIFGCTDNGCNVEGWCIGGVASCDMGTCANNAFGNHLSATSANPPGVASKIGDAFTGPYPIAVPSGRRVWLWEDGGGIHLGVYNGTTLIEEATPIDIDCDQGDKTFSLNDPALACCSGFGGVVITLTPCGGPIVHV